MTVRRSDRFPFETVWRHKNSTIWQHLAHILAKSVERIQILKILVFDRKKTYFSGFSVNRSGPKRGLGQSPSRQEISCILE
jgi:hypothetical protein